MSRTHSTQVLTGSAGLEKQETVFFFCHPNSIKPLMGPFLSQDAAEYARAAIRSPEAVVEARTVDRVDDSTRIHAEARGRVMRAFVDTREGSHD